MPSPGVSSWLRNRTWGYFTSSATWEALFYVLSLSLVAKSCPTLATPWTVACQPPLSMGFSREECWSGWPFPSPGDHSDSGIEPKSPALQADSLPTELWGKPCFTLCAFKNFLVIATAVEHVGIWIWWQALNVLHWKYKQAFKEKSQMFFYSRCFPCLCAYFQCLFLHKQFCSVLNNNLCSLATKSLLL